MNLVRRWYSRYGRSIFSVGAVKRYHRTVQCGDIGINENESAVNKLAFYRGRFGETEYIDVNLLDEKN